MTPLEKILHDKIGRLGPISVAEYMTMCLLHPDHGYYVTRDPLGSKGDFTTAPEISQMFGELIGLWLVQCWLDQGAPGVFTLAELGPGRGTLMADALRAAGRVDGFLAAARLCLVEASPSLKEIQRTALEGQAPEWVAEVAALPEGPLFLIANEFFDTLPVHQYARTGDGWRERLVGLEGKKLAFGLGPILPKGAMPEDTPIGAFHEASPAAVSLIGEGAGRIARFGGAALVVDYGGEGTGGDTFQAVKAHRKVHPLSTPGEADLTAHVDFAALRKAAGAAGASVTPTATQGQFLERLGITARARLLAAARGGAYRESVASAHRRLTHPEEMGTLFKALALYPTGQPEPPGFAADEP